MLPTWVVQSNINSEASEWKLTRSLEQLGIPHISYALLPFDPDPLDIPTGTPTIFYGSVNLVRRAHAEKRWTPGVWYDPGRTDFVTLQRHYGSELFNADSDVITVMDFLSITRIPPDAAMFIRPVHDTKAVTGRVRSLGEWQEHIREALNTRGGPSSVTLLQMATPKTILNEWRVYVVNGKPVTASSYRVNGRPNTAGDVPEKVLGYAGDIAKTYSPHPVYVLDVCEAEDHTLKVMEINAFNASGFYWCDVYKIALEVTDFVRGTYG
jgi:hypothetical protein